MSFLSSIKSILLFILFLCLIHSEDAFSQKLECDDCFPGSKFFYNIQPKRIFSFKGELGFISYKIDDYLDNSGSVFVNLDLNQPYASSRVDVFSLTHKGEERLILRYDDEASLFKVIFKKHNISAVQEFSLNTKGENTNSIGISWYFSETYGGFVSIYLDGLIVETQRIQDKIFPLTIDGIDFDKQIKISEFGLWDNYLDEKRFSQMHINGVGYSSSIADELPSFQNYSRDSIKIYALDVLDSTIWGVNPKNLSELGFSDDYGDSFNPYYKFNGRVRLVKVVDQYQLVVVDSIVFRTKIGSSAYSEVLRFYSGRYPVNDWSITHKDSVIFISEYGRSDRPARLFRSNDYGLTWEVALTLEEGTDHIHAVKIDPFSSFVWVTFGDKKEGILFSRDLGKSWEHLYTSPRVIEDQNTAMLFFQDRVIFASDATYSGCLLAQYNKITRAYSNLSPIAPLFLSNVYALGYTDNNWIWWYGNYENVNTRRSSLFVSFDLGQRPVLVEDLGHNKIDYGYSFIQLHNYLFIGANRINIPIE